MVNRYQFKRAKNTKEKRKIGTKGVIRESLFIICEGEKTEPQYFEGFREAYHLTNITIEGYGYNTDKLVEIAKENIENYDQIWCVFDRDSFPARNFNRAFHLIKNRKYKNKIRIAYSNEAFELWYLLHFNYQESALHRDQYKDILSRCLERKYEKNSKAMYNILLDKQDTAIRNAQRLLDNYQPLNPETDNPSTTVHLLVKELNKYRT